MYRILFRAVASRSKKCLIRPNLVLPSSCFSTNAKGDIKIDENNEVIRIQNKAWPQPVTLSPLWLRDHCRCPECFNHSTIQRQRVPHPSWLRVNAADITVKSGTLIIQWEDGHQTTYDLDWLWENSFESRKHSEWMKRELWDPNRFQNISASSVNFEKLLTEESSIAQLIRGILSFGFSFVSSAPNTKEATRLAIERVAEIQKNLWGSDVAIVEPDRNQNDMSYGTGRLTPHTDCNYLFEAPGLQVFHVLEPAPEGGETVLVDGFHAATELKSRDPQAYNILASAVVQFEFRERNGFHFYKNSDNIIKHDPITKELAQIRFSVNDLSPLSSVPPEALTTFYRAYLSFYEELIRNEVSIRLLPGRILFVDNWRVLHARASFSGRRVVASAYVARSDFLSRARTLGVVSGLN